MGMGEVIDLAQDSLLIIIGEYHGNPGSIVFYGPGGHCLLSLYISVLSVPASYSRTSGPVIEGDNELVPLMSELLSEDTEGSSQSLVLDISGNTMEFKENGKVLFSLRIKSYMVYEGDEDCSL